MNFFSFRHPRLQKWLRLGGWIGGIIGLTAAGLGMASLGTFYVGNQSIDQVFVRCSSYGLADYLYVQVSNNTFTPIPRSVVLNVSLARHSSSVYPSVGGKWGYAFYYTLTQPPGETVFGSFVGLPVFTIRNTVSFQILSDSQLTISWKFNVTDFTRIDYHNNFTILYDSITEQYSSYTASPWAVTRSSHDSRQLNYFLPIYPETLFSGVRNATTERLLYLGQYDHRAEQLGLMMLTGLRSMLSVLPVEGNLLDLSSCS